jgi:hypothetical protein
MIESRKIWSAEYDFLILELFQAVF